MNPNHEHKRTQMQAKWLTRREREYARIRAAAWAKRKAKRAETREENANA